MRWLRRLWQHRHVPFFSCEGRVGWDKGGPYHVCLICGRVRR